MSFDVNTENSKIHIWKRPQPEKPIQKNKFSLKRPIQNKEIITQKRVKIDSRIDDQVGFLHKPKGLSVNQNYVQLGEEREHIEELNSTLSILNTLTGDLDLESALLPLINLKDSLNHTELKVLEIKAQHESILTSILCSNVPEAESILKEFNNKIRVNPNNS